MIRAFLHCPTCRFRSGPRGTTERKVPALGFPSQRGEIPGDAGKVCGIGLVLAENGWGYNKIQGELLKVGHQVSAPAIRRVLKALKIPPAPRRRTGTTWRKFLRAQAATMLAAGFHPRGLRGHLAAPALLLRHRGRPPVPARPRRDREPGRAADHAAGPPPLEGAG